MLRRSKHGGNRKSPWRQGFRHNPQSISGHCTGRRNRNLGKDPSKPGLLQLQLLRSQRFPAQALRPGAQGIPARCKVSHSVSGALHAPFPVDKIAGLTAGGPSSLAACSEPETRDTRCTRPGAAAGAAPGSVAISQSAPPGRPRLSTPTRRCDQSHDPAVILSRVSPSPGPSGFHDRSLLARVHRVLFPSCPKDKPSQQQCQPGSTAMVHVALQSEDPSTLA